MTTAVALRADARACWEAAVAAVEPGRLVARAFTRTAAGVQLLDADGRELARHEGPVCCVGAGKAALAMARAVGPAATSGVVIVPHPAATSAVDRIVVAAAAHPVPDAAGEVATRRVLAAAAAAGPDTLLVVVLSGGASALLVAPTDDLTLVDKQAVTRALLAGGASIEELNCVRRHCSAVKGGGLARAGARAAGIWTLALSDVIGDVAAVISSGPTVGDPTTFADAAAVLARRLAPEQIPPRVAAHVARGVAGAIPDMLRPDDPLLARTRYRVVGGNRTAVAAAAEAARRRGYVVTVLDDPVAGDATDVGRAMAARLRALPTAQPVALIAGGETTVRVAAGGRGGRSQQLALSAAVALAGAPGVVLAAGTDGIDGPTDAAGACVDGGTVARARGAGLDATRALDATDSLPLLDATGDLLRTGPTGTNVADVVVALRGAC